MKILRDTPKADILSGTLWKQIPQFALPVALTAILEQFFNATDIAILGNFADANRIAAVAAVGANAPLIALSVNLFVGMALGANVVIAHAIGAGKTDDVSRAVHTALLWALLCGVPATLLGEAFAAPALRLLDVPEEIFPLALLYLRLYWLGLPALILYNFAAAIFRSVGETRTPLSVLIVSAALNVLLDLLLVKGFSLSVDGVAIGTVIAHTLSAIVLCFLLCQSPKSIRLAPRRMRIDPVILRRILSVGIPTGLATAVFSVSNIIIQDAINSLGPVVMAASAIAFNIEIITYNVLNSFSQACMTFVGQNFGAGNFRRCREILRLCLTEGLLFLFIAGSTILFLGKPWIALFTDDSAIIEIGYIRLLLVFLSHIFTLLYEVMSAYLRGFGIALVPAILTMLGVCGVRIAWVHWIFPEHHTFQNLVTAFPVSMSVTLVLVLLALLYYRPTKHFRKST